MAGKQPGFLTDSRRSFLNTPEESRDERYSNAQKSQIEAAISDQAIQAIEDLSLIARGLEKERLAAAFPADILAGFLGTLVDRLGMEEAWGEKRYYEVLLNTIEQKIHEKYREQGRFFKIESSDYPIMPSKPAYRDIRGYGRK